MTKKNKGRNTSTSGTPAPASTDPPSLEPPPQSNIPTQSATSGVPLVSCGASAESTEVSIKAPSGFEARTDSPSTIMSSMKSVAIASPATADDLDDDGDDVDKVNLPTKSDSDILEASGTSGDPGPSAASGTSDDPGPSAASGTSDDPGPSAASGTSDDPGQSAASGTSDDPGQSGASGISDDPGPSAASGTSDDPGPSAASEISDDPGPSAASGTSDDPGPSDKKKRDPVSSPESSHDSSSVKKRKCSAEESVGCQIPTPTEPVMPEPSPDNVVSNIRYDVSTPNGDYHFYGPRREFTVINLRTSEVVNEQSPIELEALPPNYVTLAQQPEDSFLVTDYHSNCPNWEESAYMRHQIRHLYYISEEKTKICASGADASRLLPDNIEIGIRRALDEAVEKIRDYLVYQTRCEEENVFNQEFYSSRVETGYKPPFSNTEMFQQIPASESVIKLTILLLALADAAMDNVRLVAGIGYCYVAHRMITGFRLLSLLEQPYKVLDHFIRQKVSAAVYSLELYTEKDCGTNEKPYDEVCACFAEITSTISIMTANQTTWQAHELFHDPTLTELSFIDFIEKMVKPRTRWTMDSRLAWTTNVITAIRTARLLGAVLGDVERHETTPRIALLSLKKHYATLRDFEIDLNDPECRHVAALVANFRSLSLYPLLECIQNHEEADEIAIQLSDDLTIAIEAERNAKQPNPVYFEQLLEDRMAYTLSRLFYHMWETHKPKHVTMIRLQLLGICQAALELKSRNGDRGKFRALVALSSIMYMDYTCGMVSKASEISIKKARERCHEWAKDNLSGDEQCKNTCLTLLTLKMEEIQHSIFGEDNKTEQFKFEVCCRVLKMATLAYPVLSYFGGIASVDQVDFPEVEDPADESYRSRIRKRRPLQNGQKLLYVSVPDNMNRSCKAAHFLKLGDQTVSNTKRMMGAAAVANTDDALESDSDEDDTEDDEPSTEVEEGNARLFLADLPPSEQRDVPGFFSTTRPLPARETLAEALEKFTRPSEAVAVMLEPLRADLLSADAGSVERPESETYASESAGSKSDPIPGIKALQKMEAFKPIDLKNFYKVISHDKRRYSEKTFAFESSKLEEAFSKTLIPMSTGEVEDNFLDSLRIVLRFLLVIVNKMLGSSRGDFDELRRHHWKKWVERIVLLTNLLKVRRLTLHEYHRLHQVMYSYCVILGFPIRIFMNPETC